MRHTYLMCAPTYYGVTYDINPWMTSNIGNVDHAKALAQWQALYDQIAALADVKLIDPVDGLPDMVFTANAGYLRDNKVWVSTFKNEQRTGEERYFREWFSAHGYVVVHDLSDGFVFEGAGDCLNDSHGETWIGYGKRTDEDSIHRICNAYSKYVWHKLRVKTDEFYHLDTCFCPLSKGHILWYPAAFDSASRMLVELLRGGNAMKGVHEYDHEMHIDRQCFLVNVGSEDAHRFACNAVCIDEHIICNLISDELNDRLTDLGYIVHQTDLSEFMKAGGSAKCLTLQLS